MDDAWIVRDDVEEILRLLERTNDRIVRAFEDANDAALGAIASPGAGVTVVARDPGDDFVTVHGCAGVFCRDEEILFARLFSRKESIPGLMDVQCSRDQVRLGGQDVTVLANARDLAVPFHLAKDRVEPHPHATLAAELVR